MGEGAPESSKPISVRRRVRAPLSCDKDASHTFFEAAWHADRTVRKFVERMLTVAEL
jgi:hypothetical protein